MTFGMMDGYSMSFGIMGLFGLIKKNLKRKRKT